MGVINFFDRQIGGHKNNAEVLNGYSWQTYPYAKESGSPYEL